MEYGFGKCAVCGEMEYLTLHDYLQKCFTCRTGARTIPGFMDEYRFLSNFWYVNVTMYGKTYRTVEHAYQAAKTLDPDVREQIRMARTAGQAKRLGARVHLRPDWEEFKEFAMEELLRRKFAHPDLRAKLIATGNAHLIEGNNWHDTYWGVCWGDHKRPHAPKGKNRLGNLLMKVRDEINAG